MRSPLSFQAEFSNSDELRELFAPKNLYELARRTGFMERERELTASDFVHLCTFFEGADDYPTLGQMKAELLGRGVSMSESSISERFGEAACGFMGAVFGQVLATSFKSHREAGGLGRFTDVILADSSVFNLHERCAGEYRGSGGGASTAAAKIQFCFGLVTSTVYELFLRQGVESDNGHRFKDIVRGALYLFDLGYFGVDNFEAVIDGGAYFLCRYKYGTNLYRPDGRPVTKQALDRLVRMLKPGQTVDMQVLLAGRKTPARLVLHKLPREVGDSIRRKLKADKQKKRKDMSPGRMAFCDVNAFITNLDAEQLPAHKAREVYSLRWQVEIMFKTWKSGLEMDNVRNIGPKRLTCLMYGRLIRMLLCCRIFWKAKLVLWREKGRELSEIKGIKLVASRLADIREWLVTRKLSNSGFLARIWVQLTKACLKEAKKGDLLPFETIAYYA